MKRAIAYFPVALQLPAIIVDHFLGGKLLLLCKDSDQPALAAPLQTCNGVISLSHTIKIT